MSTYLILSLVSFLCYLPLASAGPLDFSRYHSQTEINQYMADAAKQYPQLSTKVQLGKSAQGREISYLVITSGTAASLPAIYLNGTHHGDEWSSTESILGFADYLITHQTDPQVAHLLATYAFYLQPLVNPDGHQAETREDSFGNDPNRDYSFPGQSDAASFKTQEIQLVKKLVDQIKPVAAGAYHSGIEEVLWPWCYSSQPAPADTQLSQIAQSVATSMGFDRFLQSYDDYATEGEFIDYTYMKFGTISLTYEVSEIKTPPASDLKSIVQRAITGTLAFAEGISSLPAPTAPTTHGQFGRRGHPLGPRLE